MGVDMIAVSSGVLTVLDLLRYTVVVVGAIAAISALRIAGEYGRLALRHGPKALWHDLTSLNLPRLLPIHVTVVSFCMAGYLVGASIDVASVFGGPPSWRLVYLPLNTLTAIAITMVSLFIRNRGKRVVEDEEKGLRDRTDSAETLAHLEEQRLRSVGQDLRQAKQDDRDVHQEEREAGADKREGVQDQRETAQQGREEAQNVRKGIQDKRERTQNTIEEQNIRE